MKKIFTIISLSVLVWGCAKKIAAPAGSGISTSGAGTPAAAPVGSAKIENKTAASTAATNNTTPAYTTTGATKVPVEASKATAPEVLGQSTYNAKCGRCHGLKVTTDYTSDRWVSIMQVMASKASLTDVEKDNVLAYVRANSKK